MATTTKLSPAQERMLAQAQTIKPVVCKDGSSFAPGLLVSGNAYRTARALARRGYGVVGYQGPNLGWFKVRA